MRKFWIVVVLCLALVLMTLAVNVFAHRQPIVSTQQGSADGQIMVHAPYHARIFFDNEPTKQVGTSRLFTTPPLAEGVFTYDVRMEVDHNGKTFQQVKTVDVSPRKMTVVNFNNWLAEATTGEQLVPKIKTEPKTKTEPKLSKTEPKTKTEPKLSKIEPKTKTEPKLSKIEPKTEPKSDSRIRPWQQPPDIDPDQQPATMKLAVARPVEESGVRKRATPALAKEEGLRSDAEERVQPDKRKRAPVQEDRDVQQPPNKTLANKAEEPKKETKIVDLSMSPRVVVPVDRAILRIHVPNTDAVVSFDGQKTPQKGKVRDFRTPQLSSHIVYTYRIEAVWGEKRQHKVVIVQPGKLTTVRFGESEL